MKLKEILSLILLPFLLLFVAAMSSGLAGMNLFLVFLVLIPLEFIYILYKLKKIKMDGNLKVKNVISMIILPFVIFVAAIVFGEGKHATIAGFLLLVGIDVFIFDLLYALIFVLKHTWNG